MSTIEIYAPQEKEQTIAVHEGPSLDESIEMYEAELAELTPKTGEYTAKKDIVDYLHDKKNAEALSKLVQNYMPKNPSR